MSNLVEGREGQSAEQSDVLGVPPPRPLKMSSGA